MDNKRQELMDALRRVFSDESAVEVLVEAQSVEEIQDLMKKKEVPVTQKDCELLLTVKDKDFVRSLSEMKSNEEVQTALEEKGFELSADECAMFRLATNKSAMESLTKARNTEEVRDILEEKGITFSPEAYSNLEWNLEVDVELSEDELSNVAGGSWLQWLEEGLEGVALGTYVAAPVLAMLGSLFTVTAFCSGMAIGCAVIAAVSSVAAMVVDAYTK